LDAAVLPGKPPFMVELMPEKVNNIQNSKEFYLTNNKRQWYGYLAQASVTIFFSEGVRL
jgi:hypothetical protein